MAIISKIRVNGIDYDINADTLDGYHAGDFGLTSARTFNEITITNDAVGDIPLTVNAITSTTAHLQDWKVNNTAVGSITADGGAYLAGTANIGSITARTAYDAGTAYTVGTVVSYNNKVYICRKATTAGTIPTTTANWIEIGLDSRFNALIGTGNAATIWNNGSDLVLEADTGNLNFVGIGNVPLRIFSHIATAGGIQSGASVPFHFNVLSATEQAIGAFTDYTGSAWRARGTTGGLISFKDGAWNITGDIGRTIGGTYTPTSRLYIAADGKTGIATTAPMSLFEVKGTAVNTGNGDILTINQNSASTGYYSSLAFAQGISNIGARIVSGNNGSYYGYLSFQVHTDAAASLNTVEKLRIDYDGKVTIPYFTSVGFVKTSAAGVLSVDTTTINDGTLSWAANTAGATNTTVAASLSGAYSANTATNRTMSLAIGPAITALATVMTGATTGFIKKTAADSYSLDNSTYLTAEADTLATVTARGTTTLAGITTSAYNMGTTGATTTKATMQYDATAKSIKFIFA